MSIGIPLENTKSRSPARWEWRELRPMIEAGATSTQAWNVPSEGLLAPPGIVMVAPLTLLRKAEGTQSKGRVVSSGRVEQRGQQHTHYKGRDTPWDTLTPVVLVAAGLIGAGQSEGRAK